MTTPDELRRQITEIDRAAVDLFERDPFNRAGQDRLDRQRRKLRAELNEGGSDA